MSSSYSAKKTPMKSREYDLIPPNSDELEKSILGCMINNKNCLYSGLQALNEEDFYNSNNEKVFKVIKKELEGGTEVDEIIIAKRLEGTMDDPKFFVLKLLESVTSSSYFDSQIKTLKDLTVKRNLRKANDRVLNLIKENRLAGEEFKREALRIISEACNLNDGGNCSQLIESTLLRKNFIFNPQHIKDVLNKEEEPMDWIWDGYIAKGSLILLAGSPKVGKSTFAYHMVVGIANGNDFLDAQTIKTPVLLLALEEREQDVRRRLSFLCADGDIYIQSGLFPISQLEEVKKFVVLNNIGLVLIDTLGKIWNVEDEDDAAITEKAISPLLQLARDTNAAVVLIHHLRKSPGSDGMDIRGSSVILASVDNAISLKRYGEGNERLLETLGRWDCFSEVISLNENCYERLGSKSEVKQSAQKRKVLDFINYIPLSARGVSELTGLSVSISATILKRLFDDGEVDRIGSGKKNDPFLYSKVEK